MKHHHPSGKRLEAYRAKYMRRLRDEVMARVIKHTKPTFYQQANGTKTEWSKVGFATLVYGNENAGDVKSVLKLLVDLNLVQEHNNYRQFSVRV